MSVEFADFLKKVRVKVCEIKPLRGDGSNRKFYRLMSDKGSLILILPQDGDVGLKEAYSYYRIGNFLRKNSIATPLIHAYDEENGILLVEDLGDVRLYDLGEPSERSKYNKTAIEMLASFQRLSVAFNLDWCYDAAVYDFQFLWAREILYFKEWYVEKYKGLKVHDEGFDRMKRFLEMELDFSVRILMHRDYQSKNLMIKDGSLYLVDFQGMRLGPPWYDLASFIIDPYREITDAEGNELIAFYGEITGLGYEKVYHQVKLFSLVRLMQALAAYVKLTSLGKTWFKKYIPIAEAKLKMFVEYLNNEESLEAVILVLE